MIKIICINDNDVEGFIKIGEIYYSDMIESTSNTIHLWNLNNEKITVDGYYKHRFITLALYREKQIDEIIN